MWQVFQFPLCPFSRKVRLLLSEKGIAYELWRENPWELREEFTRLNPAMRTPVLRPDRRTEREIMLVDSRAICEYFEETVDKAPMINGTAANRAEIRRLVALFDENFYSDVTGAAAQRADEEAHRPSRQPPIRARCARRCGWPTSTSITSTT